MIFFYKLLVFRPVLVLFVISVFSLSCILTALLLKSPPDFSDPTLGFEARGTEISKKLTTWRNLLEETRPSGSLIVNPREAQQHFEFDKKHKKNKNRHQKKKLKFDKKMKILKEFSTTDKSFNVDIAYNLDDTGNDTTLEEHNHWDYGTNKSYDEETDKKNKEMKKKKWKEFSKLEPPPITSTDYHSTDGYFCESPNKEYVHFVVRRVRWNINESMFDANALLSMCELEQKLVDTKDYNDICQKEISSSNCCRPWSLPNYVALLSNKTSCFDINDEDVLMVKTLLLDCFQYYHGLKLNNDCTQSKCRVPDECAQFNAVYNMLHFLADRDFIKPNETIENLSAAMLFLPVARSKDALPFYHQLMRKSLQTDLIGVVAMDMGIKNALFDECLLTDAWLVGLGGIFVLLSMWLYTSSLFVTINTVIAIALSLGISYFTYVIVFKLKFFPFMNLLVLIVIVGIGSDDAFIFMKIWHCVQMERAKKTINSPLTPSSSFASDPYAPDARDSLVGVMAKTLEHASLSMLVTSLTTAAAFYASYASSITAVRCFGIFAGTAVMANYFLMITWLPASVSISERIYCFSRSWFINFKHFARPVDRFIRFYSQLSSQIEEFIIMLVINYSLLWIVVLGSFGIVSAVFVLYWPKLELPDTPTFRLFTNEHPFEVYEAKYKELFWFEKMYTSSESFKLPVRFVWGVEPIDNGNFLDPTSRGNLQLDPTFNVSAPESQVWLLEFCRSLKQQPFYQMSFGLLVPNCFIENLISWMARKCKDSMSDIDRFPCCEASSFPFSQDVFDYCLPESISALYETPREIFITDDIAGPKFQIVDKTNTSIVTSVKALVVECDSNQSFSHSFHEIERFVTTVQTWLDQELVNAPPGMKNAFFVSELDFFDLQDTLSKGTVSAVSMAMCVALLVLLLVTLNVLVSIYAIITVTLTIFSIVGTLVLLGWKLNILESVAVSTSIGLAVDFSLHYGVQYRYSKESDRKSSTRFALRMVGPTVMAALTSGVSGLLMLPSQVLAYTQIGVFLVVAMSISWIFSTFFLMSLLSLCGPQFGFGQLSISYPRFKSARNDNKNIKNQIDIINSTLQQQSSEQLLSGSSSAACEFLESETQLEMDSLSNSVVKTISLDSSTTMPSISSMRPSSFERSFRKKKGFVKDTSPSTNSTVTVCQDDNDSDFYKI